VSHEQIGDWLRQAEVLTFPSIREFGGAVLEAMAVGLMPLVIDYGGPGELATPATGRLIPLGRRDQIVSRLREALEELADDPAEVDRKGELARQRAFSLFTWHAKARQMRQIYDWVRGRASKPNFPMPFAEAASEPLASRRQTV
jgi:glycosyltransferase involved in cell wall biosynthesis